MKLLTGFASSLPILGLLLVALAADPPLPDGTESARKAIATFRAPPGFRIDLFAAEPMLASPVALCLDEKGRVYVAEEFRFNRGAEENRTRPFLLEDDLQVRTLDDRLAMYRKWAAKFDGGMDWFTRHADQVRLLEDRDGDGKADLSHVFAGGFNGTLDGMAGGVLAREGKVYFTCIPHLWLLQDTDSDGKADVRQPLLRGFGVNCAYLGHDLHGLAWGPDGKLYFSVGDRGFHTSTKEGKVLSGPRTGAVFRCNADGSELEVIHRGLRNPQELAFDQFGNLFADDNNCDKGDHSRLVYVVEDGDSGWNMAYQTIPEPYLTGPWHAERLWHLAHKGQPAWIVPPVGKLGAGPSGFAFTSGLSLPERYRNRFFMCNYTGNGGIEAFGVRPQGAGFEVIDYHDFLKPIMATDLEFGYDGKIYVSDFVKLNWDGSSAGGRVYTLHHPEYIRNATVLETARLFKEGFARRSTAELAKLLRHPDQRVRLRAQFALAERGLESAPAFRSVGLSAEEDLLARLHAVWGLGQLARRHPEVLRSVAALLSDPAAEVRAQAAKVIGDCSGKGAEKELLAGLRDDDPRVRFFAALALGKLRHQPAIEPLFAMLRENNDQDRYLRHAGVTALARIDDREAVQARAKDASAAVRLSVLLVQRRWQDRRLVRFLDDSDLEIVTEAARAIHDLPLDEELPALAQLLDRFGKAPVADLDPLLRRSLHAHFRVGQVENARAVMKVASNPNFPNLIRAEAIAALRDWSAPSPRDRVTGFWRPLPRRDPAIVRGVVEESLTRLLGQTSGQLQAEAVNLVARLDVPIDDASFLQWLPDRRRDVRSRIAALRLLAGRQSSQLDRALTMAMEDPNPRLRAEARDLLAAREPGRAVALFEPLLDGEAVAVIEKQQALAALARLKVPEAGPILDRWAQKLARGQVAPELQLDVLEALKAAADEKHKPLVAKIETAIVPSDPLARYRLSLHGGDAERGRELFVGHSVAQCIRCHAVHGAGGTAGPDLTKMLDRNPHKPREHILESMILPNAKIAPGFGSVVLVLTNGQVLAGTLQEETDQRVTITTPEGKSVTVARKVIEERTTPLSAMPSMDRALSLRELRDLVEYLATLK